MIVIFNSQTIVVKSTVCLKTLCPDANRDLLQVFEGKAGNPERSAGFVEDFGQGDNDEARIAVSVQNPGFIASTSQLANLSVEVAAGYALFSRIFAAPSIAPAGTGCFLETLAAHVGSAAFVLGHVIG
jgi:hypothetical protein